MGAGAPRLPADMLHLLGTLLSPPRRPWGRLCGRARVPGGPSPAVWVCTCTMPGGCPAARDPSLAAGAGERARVHGAGGEVCKDCAGPGAAGRGTRSGSWTRNPPTPHPPRRWPRRLAGCPKNICRGFRSPRFLPARGGRELGVGVGWGPSAAAAGLGKPGLRRAAPLPRCPGPAPAAPAGPALTVGAVALPRAGHLRRAQAALGRHREVAQHVGGREQVRRLHAARPAVCAVGTVEAASVRGYCAGHRGLGPRRAPRKAMSALGPSPTAVTAAAKARARMLRPGLPPGAGRRGARPRTDTPFRPPSEPAAPPPQRPGAQRLATRPFCRRGN